MDCGQHGRAADALSLVTTLTSGSVLLPQEDETTLMQFIRQQCAAAEEARRLSAAERQSVEPLLGEEDALSPGSNGGDQEASSVTSGGVKQKLDLKCVPSFRFFGSLVQRGFVFMPVVGSFLRGPVPLQLCPPPLCTHGKAAFTSRALHVHGDVRKRR